jgi:hypothetical protein
MKGALLCRSLLLISKQAGTFLPSFIAPAPHSLGNNLGSYFSPFPFPQVAYTSRMGYGASHNNGGEAASSRANVPPFYFLYLRSIN